MKIALAIALVLSYFFLPTQEVTPSSPLVTHLLYSFSHANIFHLLANIACIFYINTKLRLHIAIPVAIIASFLPSPYGPTSGFSAVLFAIVGIAWGYTGQFTLMLKKCLPFIIVTAIIPHVNALIHLYALLIAFSIPYITRYCRLQQTP